MPRSLISLSAEKGKRSSATQDGTRARVKGNPRIRICRKELTFPRDSSALLLACANARRPNP